MPPGTGVAGIEVRLDARADGGGGSPRMCAQLSWDGGATWTTPKTTGTLSNSASTFILGAPTDGWGRVWGVSDLSDANFQVRLTNVAGNAQRDFFLDWVAVNVFYQ